MAFGQCLQNKILNPRVEHHFQTQGEELNRVNKAHGVMLVKQGLLDREVYQKIADGLDAALAEIARDGIDGFKDGLYADITDRMCRLVTEEIGCQIHVGRSRNDMLLAAYRLAYRKSLLILFDHFLALEDQLLQSAKDNIDTVITYYTYGQPAQPGTYAHYISMFLDMLQRDFERLRTAYQHTNRSPMGSATGIGTNYDIDREYVAGLLGFDSVIENTMDALSGCDFMLEIEAAVAIMMTNFSRIAQDLCFWASDECGILDADGAICGGSSIMPQKKNPEAIEYIRVKATHANSALMDGLSLMNNTTLFPSLEPLEVDVLHWRTLQETLAAIDELREVLEHISIRRERAYQRTLNNFSGAATMAEVLAQEHGIHFTQTHHVVGGMIRRLMAEGRLEAKNMTAALCAEVSKEAFGEPLLLTDEALMAMLDPMECLESKKTGGTPKPSDTAKLLARNEKELAEQKSWLQDVKEQIAKADSRLACVDGM